MDVACRCMDEREYPGTFIVIEGADGAGTTTQSKRLAERLDAHWTCEPTDEPMGAEVDRLITEDGYQAETIALAFAADRMTHLEDEIIPRLEDGEIVVCDRYYHSSLVYQPALGADQDWVQALNRHALRPDLTVIIDIDAEVGMERIEERGTDDNIFEDLDFQSKVVLGYRRLADDMEEAILVDGRRGIDAVQGSVQEIVEDRFR